MIKRVKKLLRRLIYPPDDMYASKAEQFYLKLYLEFILESLKGKRGLNILDAGCGAGRISIPLSKSGHKVIGVDYDAGLIAKARKYSKANGADASYLYSDIVEYLKGCPDESFDCVICLELLYVLANYKEAYQNLKRVLKRGGVFIVSVKPKHYYVSYHLAKGMFDQAEMVSRLGEAKIGKRFLNWQTADEIRNMLEDLGIKNISLHGIGLVSGCGPDPMEKVVNPGKLSGSEIEILFKTEKQLAPLYTDSGRYILAIGERSCD